MGSDVAVSEGFLQDSLTDITCSRRVDISALSLPLTPHTSAVLLEHAETEVELKYVCFLLPFPVKQLNEKHAVQNFQWCFK